MYPFSPRLLNRDASFFDICMSLVDRRSLASALSQFLAACEDCAARLALGVWTLPLWNTLRLIVGSAEGAKVWNTLIKLVSIFGKQTHNIMMSSDATDLVLTFASVLRQPMRIIHLRVYISCKLREKQKNTRKCYSDVYPYSVSVQLTDFKLVVLTLKRLESTRGFYNKRILNIDLVHDKK